MKIKITRKLLKEASKETPLDESTLPPKGKVMGNPGPEDTKKFDPSGGPEFQTKRVEIPYAKSSSDPTLKVSPEELKNELSKVIKEPGVLEKVFGYLKEKFFGDSEPTSLPPAPEVEPPALKPSMPPAKPLPPPAELSGDPSGDPSEFGDEMEEPDPYGRKTKDKEVRDFVDKFGQLQEIARRHFKKRE